MHRVIAGAMCDVLQILRSTYYYEAKTRENDDEELTTLVVDIFKKSRNIYGQRKTQNMISRLYKSTKKM